MLSYYHHPAIVTSIVLALCFPDYRPESGNSISFSFSHSRLQKTGVQGRPILNKNQTWGYDIWVKGKLTIHQPTIPGVAGDKGFATKEQAVVVAKFVCSKIERGEFPPTVTLAELNQLKAL